MEIKLNEGLIRRLFSELSTARNASGTEQGFRALGKALACAESVLTEVAGTELSKEDPRHNKQSKEYITGGAAALEEYLKNVFNPENIEQRLQALKEQPKEYWVESHERAKTAVMKDPDEDRRKQNLKELEDQFKDIMAAYDDGTLFRQVLYMQMYEEIIRAFHRPLADQAIVACFVR